MAAPVDIRIAVEPLDEGRREFVVDRPVAPGGMRRFTSCEEAAGFPVAEAVLAVPGVAEAVLGPDSVTVRLARGAAWSAVEEPVRYAIATALSALGEPAAPPAAAAAGDEAIYDLVDDLFRREINPAVARHGGRVELIDVQDATVVVRMQGGCQGCGMATVTLRQGIEAHLRRLVPGLKGITDITDHAAGTNPYFQASSK